MTDSDKMCLACDRTDKQIPLISLNYKGKNLWICPTHLPLLIHKPHELADKLPDMETTPPPDPHH